jgi:hypothetical protein
MAVNPVGLSAKNHFAGESQQQFSSQSERLPANRKMDPPLIEEEDPLPNARLGENINLGRRSWWDIEPRYQVLICVDGLNLLGDNTSTINKNTETLIEASKEAGLENYVHVDVLLLECRAKS